MTRAARDEPAVPVRDVLISERGPLTSRLFRTRRTCFEEAGALDEVARPAAGWFRRHLRPAR